jgi:serine/threonine protein kinase
MCAPNDVWSLGVILVNLTCGRNPWKQASFEDSTYRAYTRSQGFLKTILPLTDQLNDILGRIFTRNPDQRITLPELRARILACTRFTEAPAVSLPSPPASPEAPTYVSEESAIEDEYDYDDEPLSPASSDSMSDGESTCSSDDGSLSSCSSLDDFEDEDDLDIPEVKTPPPQQTNQDPAIYEPEGAGILGFQRDYMYPYASPSPEPVHPMHMPYQTGCAPKYNPDPFVWEGMKYAHPVPPQLHHPVPFHYQVPLFAHIQGY